MRAAKLAGLILLLSSFNLFGQDLDGKYETFAAGGDVAIRFTFNNKKKSFSEISQGHLGARWVNRGYYFIVKDTLVLCYRKIKDPREPQLFVEKKSKRLDSLGNPSYDTYISIQIVNDNLEKMPGVNILLRTKDEGVLKGFVTDPDGRIDVLLAEHPEIDNILCSWITDEYQLNVSDFKGYNSNLKVKLSNSPLIKYNQNPGVHEYLIKGFTKKELKLQQIHDGAILIYKKVQ